MIKLNFKFYLIHKQLLKEKNKSFKILSNFYLNHKKKYYKKLFKIINSKKIFSNIYKDKIDRFKIKYFMISFIKRTNL
jgi:predicted site-specific integrase-resolvase